MASLSIRDYERMLDLAVAVVIAGDQPDLGLPELACEVNESLHGGVCVLAQVNLDLGAGSVDACGPAWLADLGQEVLDSTLRESLPSCPLARYYTDTGDQTPLTVATIADKRWWERTHAYEMARSRLDAVHELCVPLSPQGGDFRTFLIFRPPGDGFVDRDLMYAGRIQPLLIGADNHLRLLRQWKESLSWSDAAGPPEATPVDLGLTPREITVLHLLCRGLTAEAIGRQLGISPRTAVKHKENLYRKLGTSDRVTTVLRAQDLGLLPKRQSNLA